MPSVSEALLRMYLKIAHEKHWPGVVIVIPDKGHYRAANALVAACAGSIKGDEVVVIIESTDPLLVTGNRMDSGDYAGMFIMRYSDPRS